jgi:hypothetical protein
MLVILGLAVSVAACSKPQSAIAPPSTLVFLTREGCANSTKMLANLHSALQTLQRPVDFQVVDQGTLASTDVLTAYPTPTVLYANRDLFGMAEPKLPYPEPT